VVAVLLSGSLLAACSGGGSTAELESSTPPSWSPSTSACPITDYTAPPDKLPASNVKLTTQAPPWVPPAIANGGADSAAYVAAAGLPYAEEMLEVHYHAHLDINIDGERVAVPPYLGYVVENGEAALAPLHTHDDSGIIHIENSVPAEFLLGQVFIEWGVRFTPDCLGPYCSGDGKELAVFVNGSRYNGDPTKLVLAKHQEIAIEYGDTGKLPTPPSSYEFPEGL
jgi:hypothetical protein